ncbi:MAG: DUF3256 family protein [Tannerellaceae bacterium]|jgi:hypothetical protein|nr:DUF3256 family protein [Tannerellaceae bacterium]
MRRYIYLFIFAACILVGKAQEMKECFIEMPDQLIPQLEAAWRKDLIGLYESGKEARLKNTMNGYSQLMKLTEDYLLLRTTECSTMEIKMFPLVNNTHIICMVTTIDAPVPDSRLSFYTTKWEPLPASELFTPVSADWFIKEGVDNTNDAYKDVMAYLDIDLIKYQLSPDSQTLTASYTTPLYLSAEIRKKVTPYLKDAPKVYAWEKFHFK